MKGAKDGEEPDLLKEDNKDDSKDAPATTCTDEDTKEFESVLQASVQFSDLFVLMNNYGLQYFIQLLKLFHHAKLKLLLVHIIVKCCLLCKDNGGFDNVVIITFCYTSVCCNCSDWVLSHTCNI